MKNRGGGWTQDDALTVAQTFGRDVAKRDECYAFMAGALRTETMLGSFRDHKGVEISRRLL